MDISTTVQADDDPVEVSQRAEIAQSKQGVLTKTLYFKLEDVARRLVTAQGGEFEATTYPPYGSRIRIRIPPATEPARGDVEPRSQRHDRYTISR